MAKFALVVLVLALIAAVAMAAPKGHELTFDYSFEQYLKDFPNPIHHQTLQNDVLEYNNRKAIFEQNLAEIIAHNKKNLSWTMGVNEFTALTDAEFLAKYTGDYVPSEFKQPLQHKTKTIRSHLLTGADSINDDDLIAKATYPESVDWAARGFVVRDVRSQGQCGSCYAWSSMATIEFYLKAKTGKEISLGPQAVVDCFENPRHCGGTGGCHGYSAQEVLSNWAKNFGVVKESDYPYFSGTTGEKGECMLEKNNIKPIAKTTGAKRLPPNNVNAVMEQLQHGVLAVSVDASANWKSYESGILANATRGFVPDYGTYETTTNHAVVLVGYGITDSGLGYWKVRNSWGPSYGVGGYIYLPRAVNGEKEQVYVNMDPFAGIACEGDDPNPFYVAGASGILWNSWYPTGIEYMP